jgi:hypothetical protein
MAYKVFTAGTLATASDVNTYLMNQSVATFSTTSARNSAITSPVEGQLAYINANDILTYYDGSAWQNLLFSTAWVAYTPTLSNVTLGSGGTSAFYYQVVGKQVNVRGRIVLGTTGSLGGIPTFSLPVNSVLTNQFWCNNVNLLDFGLQNYTGAVLLTATVGQLQCVSASGPYAGYLTVNATRPFTWGSQDQIDISISYEAA